MVSRDVDFQIMELFKKVAMLEKKVSRCDKDPISLESDWDNPTLMKNWRICKRTAANYRRKGLEYYKRGGVIFYTQESREKFVQKKSINK